MLTSCQFCFLLTMILKNQFITCETKISDLEYKNHLLIRLTDKKFEYGTWSYLESYPTQCKLFYFMLTHLSVFFVLNDYNVLRNMIYLPILFGPLCALRAFFVGCNTLCFCLFYCFCKQKMQLGTTDIENPDKKMWHTLKCTL